MTLSLKAKFMRLAVRIAEKIGWLNIVEKKIVDSYLLNESLEAILASRFDGARFFRSMGCPRPWCVEVAHKDKIVAVRNSSDINQITVYFSIEEWRVFIEGVKKGEFDFFSEKTTK